ncbi:unnamed protein product [Soboliphyme baturini]|uniref:BRO1 domain-containing protein n=1 Tax=Soboliphyme baturini TaxID=241478 RepID=A0A183IZ22_9BILA|nr:unnamed protein product [Soboliphyme baturini]
MYTLMLAQAQESIYLKAAKDHKPGLRLKVAQECSDMYADALKSLSRDSLKGLWEREWLPIVSGKQYAFQALAQYDQSLLHNENKEIGLELARLQAATIQKALDAAKKDNDFIYHERVPDLKTLPALPKFAVAHAIAPSSPMSSRFKDIFAKLVPVSVQQAVACFDTRRAAVVSGEVARIRENTCLMNGMLASLNLPAAIDDFCRPEALPESIREKSNSVKSSGGIAALSAGINELPNLLRRNQEILSETVRLLTEEKACDDNLRQQFKDKWSRMASEKLTEPLWQEVKKYQQILETAANADGILRNKLATHRQGIGLLSQSEEELTAAVPGLQKNAVQKQCPSVVKLQELMKQVNELKDERETSVFLKALSELGSIKEDEISAEKLNDAFAPLRTRISDSIKRQEKIMGEVQQANNQFAQEKGVGSGVNRENMLKELVSAFDAFSELQENLKEGTKFYNDLTPLLLRLQQKVSDFCFARKTEKDDLMKDLQLNIVGQATSQPPTTPKYQEQKEPQENVKTLSYIPPRPPPPRFGATEQPKIIYYQGSAPLAQLANGNFSV